ncbi:MAG: FHA domain-containing protein [Anaerolineales bacterium]|nr:FHA domain-containing protein [Anaerolineales bacterium]MCX7753806.1 FHA domain-containing protein [Anaerolineales bacterium]MDW8276402.1 FHA domain-containing protein [Anaerolineales bacterium]
MSALLLLGLRFLSAAVLYTFIGWTLYLLWRSLQQEAGILSSRKITPLTITIQSAEQTSPTLRFTQSDVLIGRAPECDVILEDGTASAHHARLSFHHNQWWLEDLQSTNGTRLNEEFIETPAIVVNGDTIECGQTILLVNLE